MRTSTVVAGLILLFLPFLAVPAAEERQCKPTFNVIPTPSKILVIPLLRKDPDSAESERWAERPAAEIEAFYRTRFSAQVHRLRGVRVWEDFYREADKLTQQPGLFDRVILIGHGGFDGPVLNGQIVQNALTIEGDHVKATRIFEAQPGLAEIFTLTYNPDQNPEFNRFMESRWNELSRKDTTEIRKILTDTERRLQPLDAACMARQCPPDSLAAIPNDADRDIRRKACESICRVPLFTLHAFEAAIPDRFQHFVHTLRSLVHPNGSILLGMCNPGSKVPEREAPWEIGGVLVHSKLASGPHETYVHLLAAATERRVVGPIGKTSAEDIVDRVIRFEEGRPQLYLRIVVPDRRCAP
ncbi:hypothetical protein [Methylocaldum szegediense]|nr:hypothetical protein [Methylocaldum szegediense]